MSTDPVTAAQASARTAARTARAGLSGMENERRSVAIATRLAGYLPFRAANRIGIYFSLGEEVNTAPLIEMCQQFDKQLYAPVINTARFRPAGMLFKDFEPGVTPLRANRFGIMEPVHKPGTCVRGTELDLVCVPVVAFTRQCERVGMGGGYYDRVFADRTIRRTTLVGVAFDCQEADFKAQPHDVPMDAIITETSTYTRRNT